MLDLQDFLTQHKVQGEPVAPQLTSLIMAMAEACCDIGATVRASAITGAQGALDQVNVQGETQKKLDVIANDIMIQEKRWSNLVRAVASEEMETCRQLSLADGTEPFLLVFDPIDGSSNLEVNGVVGTIFSVLPAPSGPVSESSFLRRGDQQLAAGYALYGPQTSFVFTLGAGVHEAAYDPASQTWKVIRTDLSISRETQEFAINMSNYRHWDPPVRRYIDECLAGEQGPPGRNFNMRWLAAMVGEAHRILTRGGVFLYPRDTRAGMASGKLRLLYEANPIALLIEQAGGAATDGSRRILSLEPQSLHQRTGVVMGSPSEVERVSRYIIG